jgi:hypothetical protein
LGYESTVCVQTSSYASGRSEETSGRHFGFVWSLVGYDGKWMEQYDNLKAYQKKHHGHRSVPTTNEESSLCHWVRRQRTMFKNKRLRKDRKDMLDEIDFVWDPDDNTWQNTYKLVKDFREMHGHVNLPESEGFRARWLCLQRLDYAAGRLDPERKVMLDELGLVWVDPNFRTI